MIRAEWGIFNFIACALAGLAIVSPLVPYVIASFLPWFGFIDPLIGVVISAVVAIVITMVFYRVAISSAKELISKAES